MLQDGDEENISVVRRRLKMNGTIFVNKDEAKQKLITKFFQEKTKTRELETEVVFHEPIKRKKSTLMEA